MRRFQKKQMQDIVTCLYDMHQEAVKKLKKKQYQAVQQYLNDCQEAAIQVGEAIEQIVGMGTEAVACLEEYCEELYQVSTQMESMLPQEAGRQLKEILDRVDHAIKDIPVRKEAVFLPYKASMWDSMESVFQAADADPNCDAYVIPIPYYDKNPDGSFKEEHYEGSLFPDHIPVMDFRNYDFETRMPDMIYIHNPYDEYNFVTSVHPFFYSDSLKKYTPKLIYIPYFVCSESTRAENCIQKGVLNADVVVLQSNKIKNEYIKYFRDELGKVFPKNKFLALGSPKFDKVIHCEELQNSLTAQWKQRAEGRKIILYNTHLSSFLKDGETAVKKIEAVFEHFTQRDDVLLLWRPHPLSKATLKSMRPVLYEAYIALEKRYLEEDIGIFDESSDVYSAISVADGYYGDSSSVLSLFGVTGKPICIQNVSVAAQQETDNYDQRIWQAENEDYYRDYIHRENAETNKNLKNYLDHIVGQESSVDEKQKKCFLRFTKCPEGNSGEVIHKKMMEEE